MSKEFIVYAIGQKAWLEGGPFAEWSRRGIGICVAAELINHYPATASVPVEDFRPPDLSRADVAARLRRALRLALYGLVFGLPVYVGCMGGVGRTGLFLALIAKAAGEADPVAYVRSRYSAHAVETNEQRSFVDEYPVGQLRLFLQCLRVVRWLTNLY